MKGKWKLLCTNSRHFFHTFLAITLLASGCTGLNKLPEGKKLYTRGKIELKPRKEIYQRAKLMEELEKVVEPTPNAKILWMRPRLWFYNLVGETKREKGFKYWVKYRLGREPVLLSDTDPEYTARLLTN